MGAEKEGLIVLVTRGLDPGVHRFKKMDRRITSGHNRK
jgi:hypothetical protein